MHCVFATTLSILIFLCVLLKTTKNASHLLLARWCYPETMLTIGVNRQQVPSSLPLLNPLRTVAMESTLPCWARHQAHRQGEFHSNTRIRRVVAAARAASFSESHVASCSCRDLFCHLHCENYECGSCNYCILVSYALALLSCVDSCPGMCG